MSFIMRYIYALNIVVVGISTMSVAGCLSSKYQESSIAALEERKMYVGEKERIAIEEAEETIRSWNGWWIPSFKNERKYPLTINDNVQDVIEERDRKIRQIVDNAIKRAQGTDDHNAQTLEKNR